MPEQKVDDRGFGDYLAANYEELIDNPVEIGEQQSGTFEVNGVPHEMAFTDADQIDLDRICTDVQKACAEHVAMFGELPTDRYLSKSTTAQARPGITSCGGSALSYT